MLAYLFELHDHWWTMSGAPTTAIQARPSSDPASAARAGKRVVAAHILVVCALALVASVLFGATSLDLTVAHWFRAPAWDGGERWIGLDSRLVSALNQYGPRPPLLVAALAAVIVLAGCFSASWRPWRRGALVVVISMALGPGLLVNLIGKDHVGRPRPNDVVGLGGAQAYVLPGAYSAGGGRSFPSGHPSVAFSLASLFFCLRERRPRLARACLAGALVYGATLGLARVSVGAHFLSDIFWSFVVCYLSAAVTWMALESWSARSRPGEEVPAGPS